MTMIQQLDKEKTNLEKMIDASVDDNLLFHWMSVAIRLDFMMHNKGKNCNFDKTATYEQLKEQHIPYVAWPRRILNEIMNANKPKK